MNAPDTVQRVKELLIERLKLRIGIEEIKDNTQLFGPDSLELDSIDILELIVGIKKEFGVEIIDRETAKKVFVTIETIAEYIEKKR